MESHESRGDSMPLSNLLKSVAGTCRFCRQQAGILSRSHTECRRAFQAGWNEMVRLAGRRQVARVQPEFPPSLPGRDSQAVIRKRQYSRPGAGRGLEKGSTKRRRGREHHSRREIQTPEVPGPAGTEPEQRPHPGDGTTEPDIQTEAPVVDPSRRHHC